MLLVAHTLGGLTTEAGALQKKGDLAATVKVILEMKTVKAAGKISEGIMVGYTGWRLRKELNTF